MTSGSPRPRRLLVFCDRGAPYRGCWVIDADQAAGGFTACHELEERGRERCLLEQRRLSSRRDAQRFSTHLILHGWSPQFIDAEAGYGLLGS